MYKLPNTKYFHERAIGISAEIKADKNRFHDDDTIKRLDISVESVISLAMYTHCFNSLKIGGGYRKYSNLPYIVHPIAVLSKITGWGVTDKVSWFAAICHDLLEDTNINKNELINIIGFESYNIVKELTFDSSGDKTQYLDSFDKKSVPSLVIKIADRICNTADFQCTNPDYAMEYFNRASDLFDCIGRRRDDIINYYGNNVYIKIIEDVESSAEIKADKDLNECAHEHITRSMFSTFIDEVCLLNKHGHIEMVLDLIYITIDQLIRDDGFEQIDFYLAQSCVDELSIDILLGLLTATLPVRSRLPSRESFFNSVENSLKRRGVYEPSLLAGLGG